MIELFLLLSVLVFVPWIVLWVVAWKAALVLALLALAVLIWMLSGVEVERIKHDDG